MSKITKHILGIIGYTFLLIGFIAEFVVPTLDRNADYAWYYHVAVFDGFLLICLMPYVYLYTLMKTYEKKVKTQKEEEEAKEEAEQTS